MPEDDYLNRLIEFKLLPAPSPGIKGPKEVFILHSKSFDASRTAIWNRLLTGDGDKLGTVQILYKKDQKSGLQI